MSSSPISMWTKSSLPPTICSCSFLSVIFSLGNISPWTSYSQVWCFPLVCSCVLFSCVLFSCVMFRCVTFRFVTLNCVVFRVEMFSSVMFGWGVFSCGGICT